jgi:hypothetical protein
MSFFVGCGTGTKVSKASARRVDEVKLLQSFSVLELEFYSPRRDEGERLGE